MNRIEDLLKKNRYTFTYTDDTETLKGDVLYSHSLRYMSYLSKNGVTNDDRVIVMSDKCSDFIIAVFAVLSLGAIVVPVSDQASYDIILEIIDITRPACICVSGENIDKKLAFNSTENMKVIPINRCDFENLKQVELSTILSDESIAFILMSSGTTGRRKGIALTHRAVISNIQAIVDYMKPVQSDHFLSLKNFVHVSTLVGEILTCIYAGAHLYLPNPICPMAKTLKNIETFAPTLLFGNPQILLRLMQYAKKNSADIAVKTIYTSGAIFKQAEAKELSETFQNSQIRNVYGLTEAGPRVAAQSEKDCDKYGSVGKPIKDTYIYIKDVKGETTQRESRTNEIGIVCIKNKSLMLGYVHSGFQISYINREEYFETGDLGYIDEEGNLFIVGRANDIINVSGNNVNPNLVEERIVMLAGISDCITFGVPDQVYGSRLICLIVEGSRSISERELIQHCNRYLYSYERPKEYILCESIPVNEYHKKSRYWLSQQYQNGLLKSNKLTF